MNNQRGFGLIEMMVSIAIMSVVLAGMMQVSYIQSVQQQTNDVKNAVSSVSGSIAMTALDQTSCTAAITKSIQSYATDIQFGLPDSSTIAAGQAVAGYPVSVSSFQFTNAKLVATGYEGTKVYYGSLVMSLFTNRTVFGGRHFAPRTLASIYVTVNPAGKITQCGAILPTLPAEPPAPAKNNDDFVKGCGQIGGTMVGSACTFPTRPGNGNGDDNHDHEGSNGKGNDDGCDHK